MGGIKQHRWSWSKNHVLVRARAWVLTKFKGFVCVVRENIWGREMNADTRV